MKKYSVVIFLLLLIHSCKDASENISNNSNLDNIIISNKALEEKIDRFIANSNISSPKKSKDILLNIYLRENSDTIIQIINTPPYECKNIRGYTEFKGYKLFYFWEENLDIKLKDGKMFIMTNEKAKSCKSYVDSTYIDMPYEEFFILKKNIIFPM